MPAMKHVKMLVDRGDDDKFYCVLEIDDDVRDRRGPFDTEREAQEALTFAFNQIVANRSGQ